MRRESAAERAAWTEFIDGTQAPRAKYGNRRVEFNGKWYASQREANHAARLQMLAERGLIRDYQEQKRIVLVPGDGKLRPIVYIADFYYVDGDGAHVVDAKGYTKIAVYRLKKRMLKLLLGLDIEEA